MFGFGKSRKQREPSEEWYSMAAQMEQGYDGAISAGPEITDVSQLFRTLSISGNIEQGLRAAVINVLVEVPSVLLSTDQKEQISIEVAKVANTLIELRISEGVRSVTPNESAFSAGARSR